MRLPPVALRTRLLYLAAAAFLPVALVSGLSLFALLHQQRQTGRTDLRARGADRPDDDRAAASVLQ